MKSNLSLPWEAYMRMKGSGDSFPSTHLVERQMLLSRVRDYAAPPGSAPETTGSHRFLTIARDIGARGDEVASRLADHLHWQVFDKEIVDFIARDSRVRQDLVRELDERSQSLIHDMVERLLLMAAGISFGNEEYHKALLKTLAYLAARGKAIIVGRGSAYALQGEPGLHLRIIASQEVRVQRLVQQWQVRPEEARGRMLHVDAERRSFIQHHYRQNVDDPRGYDAIYNSDRLSVEEIVAAVLGLMVSPGHLRLTPEPSRQEVALPGSNPAWGNPHPERQ
jgi:cytidylate kinase